MSAAFDPRNWYWTINGDVAHVWSSAAGAAIPINDAGYVAWLANGNAPNTAPSIAVLATMLNSLAPDLSSTIGDAVVVDGMKSAQAQAIVASAIFRIVFNHENRIRAIERNLTLNGSPANLTPAQAVAAVKALL
jgi:hypothetical protein